MLETFKELFDGKLGTFKSLPHLPLPKVEKELKRLEDDGVITQTNFAEWGTPIVPMVKSDGERYRIPRMEELHLKLQGGKKYSKIDLKDAYNQLILSEDSKMICTWSTHKGAYIVNKMPFGITPATSIFQRIIEGRNESELLKNLKKLLQTLLDAGLKVKISKFALLQDEIQYLGFLINKHGIKKMPKKINEILKLQSPKTPKDVKQIKECDASNDSIGCALKILEKGEKRLFASHQEYYQRQKKITAQSTKKQWPSITH
jgi:hypothetical protein